MKVGSKARRFLVRTDSDMVGWLYFGEESWFDFSFVLYDFWSMLFFIFEFFSHVLIEWLGTDVVKNASCTREK